MRSTMIFPAYKNFIYTCPKIKSIEIFQNLAFTHSKTMNQINESICNAKPRIKMEQGEN
ncbi:hypothetical protein LBMAG43_10710 [Methylococcaceae bacterium]|nr:hypothetical protein LBMAG43_10710 [Methylococcaceae bacterium]